MKNDIIMGQYVVEKHGKLEENACFGDDHGLLCPECFSSNVYICDKINKRYILKEGFLFEKVCSSRQISCLKCGCEFLQLGNDVRKEKMDDFSDRIKLFFVIFFTLLFVVSIILTAVFAMLENDTLSLVFLFIFLLSMIICAAICS